MKPEDFFQNSRIRVWPGTFSVIQARKPEPGHVMVFIDREEVTVVAATGAVASENIIREETGWKILTFDAVLPFELTGFLAAVTAGLAEAGVAVFAISSFSTDHLLVKEEKLEEALEALEKMGIMKTQGKW